MSAEFLLLLPRLFLQRSRISQAGAEATEPASWDLHQPLHGECRCGLGVGYGLSLGAGDRILRGQQGSVGWKPCPSFVKLCLGHAGGEWVSQWALLSPTLPCPPLASAH